MGEHLLPVDGVCGVDPAVDVHDAAAHAVRHAVDRVADKLPGGHLRRHSAVWRYLAFSVQ